MFKYLLLLVPFLSFAEDIAKISEAVGHLIGKNLESLGLDFDLNAIVKGLKEESEGRDSPMNEDECMQAIATLQEEKMESCAETELKSADTLSNGHQLIEDENHSFPTSDSAEYR